MPDNPENPSPEIDIMQLVSTAWRGRRTILITTSVFFVIGLFLVFISPKEYTSGVSLLVEAGGSNPAANSAILKQLSALTGVPNTATQDALTPALYPLVVSSAYFQVEVLNKRVTDSKTGSKITLSQYFDNHPPTTLQEILMKYTLRLPWTLYGAIRGGEKMNMGPDTSRKATAVDILPSASVVPGLRFSVIGPAASDSAGLELTPKEKSQIGFLSSRIKAEIKKGAVNLLRITVKMDDPVVAKELAGSVVTTLTKYIIDYRTRKVKNDREFTEALYAEAETKYKRAQQALASYHDRNQNVVLSSARIQGESLQADYNLAFNVYNSLAQLLEQAKINVQENTPVFTMIEPPSDAAKTSSGNTIIMIMIFLGIMAGVGIVFGKPAFKKLKGQLKEGDKVTR